MTTASESQPWPARVVDGRLAGLTDSGRQRMTATFLATEAQPEVLHSGAAAYQGKRSSWKLKRLFHLDERSLAHGELGWLPAQPLTHQQANTAQSTAQSHLRPHRRVTGCRKLMSLVDPTVDFVVGQESSAVVVMPCAQQLVPVCKGGSRSVIFLKRGSLRMKYLRQLPTTLRCSPASRARARVSMRISREARLAEPQTCSLSGHECFGD